MRARIARSRSPPGRGDREQLVVTEIPYQVNKARAARQARRADRERSASMASARCATSADRDGIRLVIELKKDVLPQIVINHLYRQTDLQTSFGVINLAIDHGRPAILNAEGDARRPSSSHRRDVVTKRTRYDLRKAEAQRELVEGLGIAVADVDVVVRTIRESPNTEVARNALMQLPLLGLESFVRRAGRPESEIEATKARTPYNLTERQAKAILEMRLSRLTGLEQEKLATEYGELCDAIARYRAILSSAELLDNVIVSELQSIRATYADKRRTEILDSDADIPDEALIQEEDMVVTISHAGYIKRTSPLDYRAQRRGGQAESAWMRGRRTG